MARRLPLALLCIAAAVVVEVGSVLVMQYASTPSRDAYIVVGVLQGVPLLLLGPVVAWIGWRTRRVQWQALMDKRQVGWRCMLVCVRLSGAPSISHGHDLSCFMCSSCHHRRASST
jgi:hypothetical protein